MMRDPRDAPTIALTCVHAGVLLLVPSALTVGLLLWFNANALSHQHVHRRFFRARALDAAFSAWLSLLLGLPQRLWRARHLAHHAGRAWRLRVDRGLAIETALVLALWITLIAADPVFFATVYLPGLALGLGLCALHGHGEHCAGTTSCYGRLWNLLFRNDGYHVEHHAHPTLHVLDLPRVRAHARGSRWPPVLRWLERVPGSVPRALDALERVVVASPRLQRVVLRRHRHALQALLAGIPAPRRVVIVGGGLFPRSAILARELWPRARIAVLDCEPTHLGHARMLLPEGVTATCGRFTPGQQLDAEVAFLPLALCGDRDRAYAAPPAPWCVIHDWVWRPRGKGRVVAWWLLKRVNLVHRASRQRRVGVANPAQVVELMVGH